MAGEPLSHGAGRRDSSPFRGAKKEGGSDSHGAGRRKELTCVSYVIMPDGRTVPVGELTGEERAQWQENMRRRLSEDLSAYYTQHP